jgi:hypothetical protein
MIVLARSARLLSQKYGCVPCRFGEFDDPGAERNNDAPRLKVANI